MAQKRATEAEKQKILTEVITLLLEGYDRKSIVQFITENHGISERHVDNYLSDAYEEITNKTEEYRGKLIKQSLRRFNDLYNRNLVIQDYRECRQVQESIIDLFGLAAPKKLDHTTKGEKIQAPIIRWTEPNE